MPDTKITALTAIGANPIIPSTFPIPMVDLTDTSMAASGTTKKVTVNQILGAGGTATLASATITGDLTVDTSTLKVDSANNRVGVVQATPLYPLHLVGEFGLEEASPAGTGSKLRFIGDATKYNFRIGKQLNVSNGFEITPSTTVGGTTFSNPVYTVTNDGIHTFLDGAGGTRMTLNSTGLGVGIVPSGGAKLAIRDSGSNDSYIGLGANNDIYLSTGTSGVHYFRKAANAAAMTLDASGRLFVGATSITAGYSGNNYLIVGEVTSPTIKLQSTTGPAAWDIYSAGGLDLFIAYNSSDKGQFSRTTGAYTALSDANKKRDFEPSNIGLAEVLKLQPKLFRMIDDSDDAPKQLGFVAQDVQSVIPQAYSENEGQGGKFIGLQDRPIIAALTRAIQELTARVQTLETR